MAPRNRGSWGSVDRRRFLALAGAAVGGVALSACGTSATPIRATSLVLPTEGTPGKVTGQYISSMPGVPPAYTVYPEPYQTVFETPGSGGDLSALLINYYAPPPSTNRWLSQFNKNLGVNLQPTLMTSSDISEKTAAIIASGDLPDIFYLNTLAGQAPAAAESVLEGAFTDLTEYLAGDAIKEYPNLALIPDYSWEDSAIEGHFYGVPHQTGLLASGLPAVRLDWARKMGLSASPSNSDEMYELLTGITKMKNPSGQQAWAFSSLQIYWQDISILMMFGVPNNWQVQGGKLVKDIETDEFEEALAYMVKLWKAGAYHPNAAANTWTQEESLWYNGQIGVWGTDLLGDYTIPNPAIAGVSSGNWWDYITPLITPAKNGGVAPQYEGNPGGGGTGNFGIFAIPATVGKSKAKVREILRVLNYTAAPFGSKEYTFMEYGIEGWNFSFQDGTPQASANGNRVAELAPHYFAQPSDNVLYLPYYAKPPNGDLQSFSLTAQKIAEQVTQTAIGDPTATLVSPTDISEGPNLAQQLNDSFVGIVTGRTGGSLTSALSGLRQQWASQGGDKIRSEYEAALAKSSK